MSESDDDLVPNSFKFPNGNTGIHTQFSKPRFGLYNNNMMTANFNAPHQIMSFDQRSAYSRRETSPMSLRSFANSRIQHQQLNYQRAMTSHGSVYNARCGSPMSVRSAYTNSNISTADIAFALKNKQFDKHEIQLIHNLTKSYMKSRMRRRVEKRRNLKKLLKNYRRNSGGESGAEGSDSSLSSDDCRSTRSAFYTQNVSKVRTRPPRMNLNKFPTQVRDNDIYTDRTDTFKHNSFRNLLSVPKVGSNSFLPHVEQQNVMFDRRHADVPEAQKNSEPKNACIVTLKDRLKKDAASLLPIHRFNMSNVKPSYEISYKVKSKGTENKELASKEIHEESDNENEDIFKPKRLQEKRVLEASSVSYPVNKRKKLSNSPTKQIKMTTSKNMKKITTNTKDFNFKTPLLPLRKIRTQGDSEILIAKSSQPLVGMVESFSNQIKEIAQTAVVASKENLDNKNQSEQLPQNHTDTINNRTVADITHNSTSVSSKPSFTKRKLFTQKLDIAENNNISSDHLSANSPQIKTLKGCREKNKVRKLTSQSCLSRDVSENNYMDLLHKLLPADQIKNQTLNNMKVANNKDACKSSSVKDGKWDVNLAVSMCDNDDQSETHTDEEIFNVAQKPEAKTIQVNKESSKKFNVETLQNKQSIIAASNCKVVLKKVTEVSNLLENNKLLTEKQHSLKSITKACVKTFWDTDYDSEVDNAATQYSQNIFQKDKAPNGSQFLMNGTNGCANKRKQRGAILSARNPCKMGMNPSVPVDDAQKLKKKIQDFNNQQENKENNNDWNTSNRSRRSRSKINKPNTETETLTNNNRNTNKVSNNKSKNQKNINIQNPKLRTTPSKKNNKQSKSIFNISRQSLRIKEKREASSNNVSMNQNKLPESDTRCNTSRESIRLKQKREAKLNGITKIKRLI